MFRIITYVFLNYPCGPFHTITRIIESKLYLLVHLKTDENFNSQRKLSLKYYFIAMIRASLLVIGPDANEYIISYLHDGSLLFV